MFAITGLALLVAFTLLWRIYYHLLCKLCARRVVTGDNHKQYVVVSTDPVTMQTNEQVISVSKKPYDKRNVIRSVSSWLKFNGRSLISITVNRPGGATIYKWYDNEAN